MAPIERALAIARSPEDDRVRFHAPYITVLNGPVIDASFRLEKIEVITEFRRIELIAEQHERAGNRSFGRGGIRDAQEALRPWTGRVTIVVHLRFVPTMRYITGVPGLAVVLKGDGTIQPITVRRHGVTSDDALVAGTVEADFAADQAKGVLSAIVSLNSRQLERVTIDFSALR